VSLPYHLPGASPVAEAALYAVDSLWVPFFDSPNGWLLRLSADDGTVEARIPIGESPSSIAVEEVAMWVASDSGDGSRHFAGQDTVSRIDLRTNRVTGSTKVEVGGPMAAGFGALFVPDLQDGTGNGTLAKLDATTGRVVARWPLAGRPVVGCDRLWVVQRLGAVEAPAVTIVSLVDPGTGQRLGEWPVIADDVRGPAEVDGACRLLALTSQDPWTMDLALVNTEDGAVEPATATITWRTRILDGELWATLDDGTFARLSADGSPMGAPMAMPPEATFDGGDPYRHVAGGVRWAIANDAAFRLVEPGSSAAEERVFGEIVAVDADAPSITLAVGQSFGAGGPDEANDAARADGVIGPGEDLPNPFYVRDLHQRRTLPVAGNALVEVLGHDGEGDVVPREVGLGEFLRLWRTGSPSGDWGAASYYWCAVSDRGVVSIVAQYVP
jgi:hypothetical protein